MDFEVDWLWKPGKDLFYGGVRLRRFQGGALILQSPGGYRYGMVDGRELDLVVLKQVWTGQKRHNWLSTGLRFADVPGFDGRVTTEGSWSWFLTGGATGLVPLGGGVALGVGIDGRFDYIASVEGGWHAEIALNAPQGSKALSRPSSPLYFAVGYRDLWAAQFVVTDFMSDEDFYSFLLQTRSSGFYVTTSLRW